MKGWEVVAHNLKKPVGVWVGYQPLIPKGERSELWTRMATESVSSCELKKS
jgi:hypothetical protein